MSDNPFRQLPAVNEILQAPAVQALAERHARELVVAAVRLELDEARERLGRGEALDGWADLAGMAQRVERRLEREYSPVLRRVINATGIVLHTNLGRAPLAEDAARAAYEAGRGYLNLE